MSRNKGTVRSPTGEDIQPVKPEPPADLWDQLGEIERETLVTRPPNSFTVMEYAKKHNIPRNSAAHTLYRLVQIGKLERYRAEGSNRVYYTLVQKRLNSETCTKASK